MKELVIDVITLPDGFDYENLIILLFCRDVFEGFLFCQCLIVMSRQKVGKL